jgi:hypothetical protein
VYAQPVSERPPARRPRWFPAAVLVIAAALPVALWGTLPLDDGGSEFGPDRILELIAGILALGVVVMALAPMIQAGRRGLVDRRWWLVLAWSAGGSVLVGLTLGVFTAETIGANIGGGLMVVFVLPVAALGYLIALAAAVRLETNRRP